MPATVQLGCRHEIDRAESPRIVERQPFPLVGLEQQMVVLLELRMIDPPAPRHAEVEDHRVVAIRVDETVFRPPAEARDLRPGQPLAKVLRKRPPQIRAPRFDTCDPPALQHPLKAADGGFDFGQLRHRARYGGRPSTPLEARPMSHASSDKVNFGEELVSPEEKTRRVGAVFSSVARRYDVMNDMMSGGLHRLWKDRFVARVKPRAGEHILDMAGGTGDIAFRMAGRGAQVTVSDINADMLEVGRERANKRGPHRPQMAGRECRGAELRRRDLRCLHDRVRHPERHRHPCAL